MRWSYKCGKLFGIDLYVHVTFLILLAWFMIDDLLTGKGFLVAGVHTALVLITFAVVVAHELGHSLAARKLGIPTRDIVLLPIGGMARLEGMPEKPLHELFVALSGPAVNLVLAIVAFGVRYLHQGIWWGLGWGDPTGDLVVYFLMWLAMINGGLLCFNLLPAFPMDGGRVLRALLGFKMPYLKATEWAVKVGRVLAVVFAVVGIFRSFSLVLIAMFIWYAGTSELNMVRRREYLREMAERMGHNGNSASGFPFGDLLQGVAGNDGVRHMAVLGPLGWQIIKMAGTVAQMAAAQAARENNIANADSPYENVRRTVDANLRAQSSEEDEPRARIIDIE